MARILIVEDDRAISGLMVRTLTVNGHLPFGAVRQFLFLKSRVLIWFCWTLICRIWMDFLLQKS